MKQRSFLGTSSSTTIAPSILISNSSIASTNSRISIRSDSTNVKENNILSRDNSKSVYTKPSSISVGNRLNASISSSHPVKLVGDSLINSINLLKNTEDLLVASTSASTTASNSGKDLPSTSITQSGKDNGGGSHSKVKDSDDNYYRRVSRPLEMILSGNIPRTYDNNFNNGNKNKPIGSTSSSSSSIAAAAAALAKDRVIKNEIEVLLNKKSSHAEEANNEWFDGYSKRLNQLSKREYAQTKAAQVQSIEIQAFCCTNIECNLSKQDQLVEQFPTFCQSKGHLIERLVAIKRFFECKQCNKRESTLSKKKDVHTKVILPPEIRCIVCGSYRWTLCGQKGSGPLDVSLKEADNSGPKTLDPTIRGGQLFLSATDWTKKRDSVSMAERVSRLL